MDVDSIDLFDEDDGDVNDNDEEDTNNPEWNECEKNFEKYLKKDQHSKFLNENDDFKEQESLRNPSWPVSKSNDQAASITKYMFETTNPKLSMGIFESINLGIITFFLIYFLSLNSFLKQKMIYWNLSAAKKKTTINLTFFPTNRINCRLLRGLSTMKTF